MSVSLHPSSTLGFPKPLPQPVTRTFTISNSDVHPVAFKIKIKATISKLYKVIPNLGRLEPDQSVEVQVTRQAMKEGPLLATKCNDRFQIQSTAITPERETQSLSDILNNKGYETHSQKISVVYLPPKGANVPEETEQASVHPVQPSELNPGEHPYAIYITDDQGALSNADFFEPQEHSSFEDTRKGQQGPAPFINVAIRHPPPRRLTPRPSREQIIHKLVEATTEVSRLGALLAATPESEVKEEQRSKPDSVRGYRGAPSTVTGTETDVSSYVDEPYQPEGASLPPKSLEMSVVSETSDDRSFASESPPRDRPSVPTDSQPLIKSTNPEMDTYSDPPNPLVPSKDHDETSGTRMSSLAKLREGTGRDGGGNLRPPGGPRTAARKGNNNTSRKNANHNVTRTLPPVLPPTPKNCFSREKLVNKILDRTDRVTSVALFGPIGVGKTSVALALMHHNRTKTKFGQNRHFMRCDDLTNSLSGFLQRLSNTLHTDTKQLHAHLQSSPPLILLLDGVDSVLDSLAPEARGISATIQTFGSYENVCLVTTSRMNPGIRGFYSVEVQTLPEDGARDTFYSLCNLPRSPAVDSLIARLDFHPLSIELLASFVRENDWDQSMLLKACGDDHANKLKTSYYKRLREAIEPALRSPTIKSLGSRARDVLKEIAALPNGIKEYELERKMAGTGEVVDVLCRFSLVYRRDGFVKMLFPFRSCFVEVTLVPQNTEEITYRGHTPAEPYIAGPPKGNPAHATPRPIPREAEHLHRRTRPPGAPRRPPDSESPYKVRPPEAPPRRKGIRRMLRAMKRRLFTLFCRRVSPSTPVDMEELANTLPIAPRNGSHVRLQHRRYGSDWTSD